MSHTSQILKHYWEVGLLAAAELGFVFVSWRNVNGYAAACHDGFALFGWFFLVPVVVFLGALGFVIVGIRPRRPVARGAVTAAALVCGWIFLSQLVSFAATDSAATCGTNNAEVDVQVQNVVFSVPPALRWIAYVSCGAYADAIETRLLRRKHADKNSQL